MLKKITIVSNFNQISSLTKNGHQIIMLKDIFYGNEHLLQDYNDFIGYLNKKFNSLSWWTTSISAKNLYTTSLYKNIYYYLGIIEFIKNSDFDEIIIALDNEILINQLLIFCKAMAISSRVLRKPVFRQITIKIIKNLKFLWSNLHWIFFTWKNIFCIEKLLGSQIKEKLRARDGEYLLRTFIDNHSLNLVFSLKMPILGN